MAASIDETLLLGIGIPWVVVRYCVPADVLRTIRADGGHEFDPERSMASR